MTVRRIENWMKWWTKRLNKCRVALRVLHTVECVNQGWLEEATAAVQDQMDIRMWLEDLTITSEDAEAFAKHVGWAEDMVREALKSAGLDVGMISPRRPVPSGDTEVSS